MPAVTPSIPATQVTRWKLSRSIHSARSASNPTSSTECPAYSSVHIRLSAAIAGPSEEVARRTRGGGIVVKPLGESVR